MGPGLFGRFVTNMGEAYPEVEKSASPPDYAASRFIAR
jgi:hypothetical protein